MQVGSAEKKKDYLSSIAKKNNFSISEFTSRPLAFPMCTPKDERQWYVWEKKYELFINLSLTLEEEEVDLVDEGRSEGGHPSAPTSLRHLPRIDR